MSTNLSLRGGEAVPWLRGSTVIFCQVQISLFVKQEIKGGEEEFLPGGAGEGGVLPYMKDTVFVTW